MDFNYSMAVAELTDALSVLIVEDDPLALISIEIMLSNKGFQCYSAISPLKALEIINGRSVDVIVCDLNMPEMNGILFHKTVYEEFGRKPFIMVTGTSGYAENEMNSLVRSGIPLIRKPFSPERLVDEILRQTGKGG